MRRVSIVITMMLLLISWRICFPAKGAQIDYPDGYTPYYNETHATALAKLLWAEARGIHSDTEKAAVVWCVLNRVEAGCGDIMQVITAPNQFAYSAHCPVDPNLYALAVDVLIRWDMERCGFEDVGRVLPIGYCWFAGYSGRNWFRPEYRSSVCWDWSLASPYES